MSKRAKVLIIIGHITVSKNLFQNAITSHAHGKLHISEPHLLYISYNLKEI